MVPWREIQQNCSLPLIVNGHRAWLRRNLRRSWRRPPCEGLQMPEPGESCADMEEVLTKYPDLEEADVSQALAYAAWLAQEQLQV